MSTSIPVVLLGTVPDAEHEKIDLVPGHTLNLSEARNKINGMFVGNLDCYVFAFKGNPVNESDESSIDVLDCLTDDYLELRISFAKLRAAAKKAHDQLKNKRNLADEALSVVDKSSALLEIIASTGDNLEDVSEKFLEGRNADVANEVARVLTCAPYVGVAFAILVPVLTAISDSNHVQESVLGLINRLERLLAYLDEVIKYVKSKGGEGPEGDRTFCSIMALIDNCAFEIAKINEARNDKWFKRIKRLLRAKGQLKTLSELDNSITQLMIERNVVESMKSFQGIKLDLDELQASSDALKGRLDQITKENRTSQKHIKELEDKLDDLLRDKRTNLELCREILKNTAMIRKDGKTTIFLIKECKALIQATLDAVTEDRYGRMTLDILRDLAQDFADFKARPTYPSKLFIVGNYPQPDHSKGTAHREQSHRSISEEDKAENNTLQVSETLSSVLESAIFLNMIFLTFAYTLMETSQSPFKNRGIRANDLNDYLETKMQTLRFSEDPDKLLDRSMRFFSSVKGTLYAFDAEPDRSYGIFINSNAKRITLVFRPMVIPSQKQQRASERKTMRDVMSRFITCEVSLPRSLLSIETPLGKPRVHSGYYDFALGKYNGIKKMLLDLRDNQTYRDYSLFVTGHSFGASIANIVAYRIIADVDIVLHHPLILTTFGSPRVGNAAWRRTFKVLGSMKKLWYLRVSNDKDPIPGLLPSILGLRHSGMNINFSSSGQHGVGDGDISNALVEFSVRKAVQNHSLAGYWKMIRSVENKLNHKLIEELYDDSKFYGNYNEKALNPWIAVEILSPTFIAWSAFILCISLALGTAVWSNSTCQH